MGTPQSAAQHLEDTLTGDLEREGQIERVKASSMAATSIDPWSASWRVTGCHDGSTISSTRLRLSEQKNTQVVPWLAVYRPGTHCVIVSTDFHTMHDMTRRQRPDAGQSVLVCVCVGHLRLR
jgi:hypothetical protein